MIAQCFNRLRVQITAFLIMFVSTFFVHIDVQAASLKNKVLKLPVLRQGTTFIYSDGTWEKVIATAPGLITHTLDFTRRSINFQNRTRQGTRTFGPRKNIFVRHSESIWPLKIGNKASYTESGTWIDKRDNSKHTYRTHWSCKVSSIERIVVPAGEFDTWKIVCSRYNSSSSARSRPREIKTWYYAPQIGHFVLRESRYFYNKPSRRQELLAVLPPKESLPTKARREIDRNFQNAMEHKLSGDPALWSIASIAASGSTTPYGTFKLDDGTFCRRYIQGLHFKGDEQDYYGMACREPGGKWIVPQR